MISDPNVPAIMIRRVDAMCQWEILTPDGEHYAYSDSHAEAINIALDLRDSRFPDAVLMEAYQVGMR